MMRQSSPIELEVEKNLKKKKPNSFEAKQEENSPKAEESINLDEPSKDSGKEESGKDGSEKEENWKDASEKGENRKDGSEKEENGRDGSEKEERKRHGSKNEMSLLGRPAEVTGCRARKQVERLKVSYSVSKEKQKFQKGKGRELRKCPRIEHQIEKSTIRVLQLLHRILFARVGPVGKVKKFVKKFSGFPFEKNSPEFDRKKVTVEEKFSIPDLMEVCKVLDLQCGGTKEDIVMRVLDFLLKPNYSRKKKFTKGKKTPVETAKKHEKKEMAKKEEKKTSAKGTKRKTDEDEDESASSDDKPIAKKNEMPPVKELSEYEKMIQRNRDEKMAFLPSLRMNEGGLKMDDEKSCSKREVQTSNELHSAVEQEGGLKMDDEKSCSKLEVQTSDELHSAVEQEVQELSEYEKKIQKNRDEKMAFLQSLRINEVKEALKGPQQPRKKVVVWPKDPVRKSVRLKDVHFDLSEETLQRKAYIVEGKRKKKKPPILTLPPILTFEEAIAKDDVYSDFAHDFDDLDFKTPTPFTDYVSYFKNMKTDKSKIAKVVNGRITAMALHPMKEKIIVSAGNKYGAVGFWHVNSDSVYEFKPHLAGVQCLKFNYDFPNQILSCSNDGTMRCGDMEKKVFEEVFNVSGKTSCNYFDFISPSTTIVCLKNGKISLVDIRSDSKSALKSHKCHDYSVEIVSVHPVNKSYFISTDTEGFLSLWDLRKFQRKPVIVVHHHRKVITSAFFSPVTGNSILTTSADDSLCLFDSSKLGSALTLDKKVRHKNSTWFSAFNANWLPNSDDAFVIGRVDNSKRIAVFDNHLKNIYNFQDKYLRCTTTSNIFHSSLPVLASGSYTGKVYIFS